MLLERRTPINDHLGRLSGDTATVTRRLREAIAGVGQDEAGFRHDSLGVPLGGEGPDTVLAHILPLATGEIRTRLAREATAAVIIAGGGAVRPAAVAGLAASFRLTEAEARMLARVAGGSGVNEAAAALGIQVATARTHMRHIFNKLGVSRHAELVALVNRLTSPTRDLGAG